ncbi:hypothetical protein BDV3_005693 [Batrachochytrium dendrobatidis]
MGIKSNRIQTVILVAILIGITTILMSTFMGSRNIVLHEQSDYIDIQESASILANNSHSNTRNDFEFASDLSKLLSRQSTTLEEAIQKYERKLGRLPPKGYSEWFERAKEKKCLIDDYDMIWEDLAPYYQLGGKDFRQRVQILQQNMQRMHHHKVSQGLLSGTSKWSNFLKNSIKSISDLDIIINELDEPRILFNADKDGPALLNQVLDQSKDNPTAQDQIKADWFTVNGDEHLELMKKTCLLHNPLKPLQQPHDFHGYLQWPMSNIYTRTLLPIISMTKLSGCFADIVIPSVYYYDIYAGGQSQADKYPWKSRTEKAYWRGSTTGGSNSHGKWHNYHRIRLARLAVQNSNILDVALSDTTQCLEQDCIDIRNEFKVAGKEPFDKIYTYKYALDVDGNTFSGRFFRLLESEALVFKMTIFNEYFEKWIVPWEHYIPIEVDFSDLKQKIEWAKNNDDRARRIAENGRRFAERILNKSQMECYTELLLLEMARLTHMDE